MVENTLKYMSDRFGVKLVKIEFSIEELNNKKILQKVEGMEHCNNNRVIHLAKNKDICF